MRSHGMLGKNVLVIGANRGIGMNLMREFVKRGWTVHETIRPQPKDDPSVQELVATGATVLEADYVDQYTIIKAAGSYGNKPLDRMVYCGANEWGGLLGYRMAKCTLNQQMKTIAQAFKAGDDRLNFLALEPGHLPTSLTGWKGEDDMETSNKGMVDISERADYANTGNFYSYTGKQLEY
ncbi:hypothetical protein VPNG_10270 [Cytospora leucostoma]|uniref:NAD(P)-binding domain-containing protein n=1 Tax=Cytospora leucostoma TaxID=1230097 RepID=A0A423VBQ8_9PEZI|nr:hypothetical protein VPNG_10270 [Cytospora leucostoma]